MAAEYGRQANGEGTDATPSSDGSCIGSNPANGTIDGPSNPRSDGFVYHKVSKMDTLAGLAIKYNITVSDIKRANGILSDNAMFAREFVKIPTAQLPIGEEAQVLFARLMSGYGRDASLNAKERKAPGTVSITQLPGSPTASRSSVFGSEAVDDDPGTPYSRRSDKSSSEPGDVELIERNMDSSAYGYGSDRVRRRTKTDSNLGSSSSSRHASSAATQLTHAAEAAVGWLSNAAAAAQAALPANGITSSCLPASPNGRRSLHNFAHSDQGSTGSSSSTAWHQLGNVISQGGSSLVQKIKRAASQPALAGPGQAAGFGDVADAVLGSRSGRLPSVTNSGSGASSSIDLLARGTGLAALPPRKDTKGD
uniref:LysM domain-containing protein n=1 Tax=Tetradesmus obliquus TaxID=3088 RepID=A0A383WL34_TETOB|eukprot:jgi/Sobl393_1/18271/SZX77869.1